MILIDQELLQTISTQAKQSAEKKYHYVLSDKASNRIYQALIGFEPGAYIAPHKHPDNVISETLILLRGEAILIVFSENGQIENKHLLSQENNVFGLVVNPQKFHTIIPLKVSTVLMEIKERKDISDNDERIHASWAPLSTEKDKVKQWLENLLHHLNIIFPEIY
ncbi:MAG: WbuC family cupin fold metalloprotein [Bacteroidales bacterium]|nr:WbuC family cupin fold metalloprotein [Bacteroidales bacterium]